MQCKSTKKYQFEKNDATLLTMGCILGIVGLDSSCMEPTSPVVTLTGTQVETIATLLY